MLALRYLLYSFNIHITDKKYTSQPKKVRVAGEEPLLDFAFRRNLDTAGLEKRRLPAQAALSS